MDYLGITSMEVRPIRESPPFRPKRIDEGAEIRPAIIGRAADSGLFGDGVEDAPLSAGREHGARSFDGNDVVSRH